MSTFGIDLGALAGWMTGLGLDVRGPLTLTRIGVGQSNLTFLLSDDATRWVLRRPPLGELVASAHDVAREYRIMAALRATPVPVPAMLGLCTDPAVCDVPTVLEEYVAATTIDSLPAVDRLSPPVRDRIGRQMALTLAAIHAVDVDAVGLGDLAGRAPYADRQVRRWSRQWEAVRTRESPLVDELAGELRRRIPEQRSTGLVHGDFHLRNLLVDDRSGTVEAVVDWELATLGDPLADVGTLLAYWPEAGDPPLPLFAATRQPGFATRDQMLQAYAEASGRAVDDVPYWHALGLWKIAVIGEGVLRRALDHPANASSIGPPTTGEIDAMLARAVQVLSS